MAKKRSRMGRKKSRRDFRLKSDVHPKNMSMPTMYLSRGGGRL